jgi:hypothetical protein
MEKLVQCQGLKTNNKLGVVVHACNASDSGGRD